MQVNVQDAIAVLGRAPASFDALLRDLPEVWTRAGEGPDTWSPVDIVGHLIHGERTNWMPRVKTILVHGDSRTFESFDRGGHEQEARGKTLPQLLDLFAQARTVNLDELRALDLQPADLERRGRHPAFGPVTLGQLLAAWVAHDLTHLHQISRVMATQYRDAVGPWAAYLGVLQCAGHSASG